MNPCMKALVLLCLGWMIVFPPEGWAGSGGPDPYGYLWKDSNEPGVTFHWVEIAGRTGAFRVPSLADDNSAGPYVLGWDFHFYWSDFSSIKIGSNGWVSFQNIGNIASCFPRIPTPGGVGDNLLAPFMSDLTFLSNDPQHPNEGELWYWSNNVDSLVVQWKNVPWWRNGTPDWIGSNSFELILSGADSSITFQYLDTDAANFPGGSGCPTFMEIGMENVTGNLGLNYATGTYIPPDHYAVKYMYPSGAAFQVPDATPVWNMATDNAGQFVFLFHILELNTTLGNVGNAPITSNITARGRVRDLNLATAWADTVAAPGLVNGDEVTVAFPKALRLDVAGQYYYDVSIETADNQDINPTNNSNVIEVVSVWEGTGPVMLSYATGAPPSESVSWAGGGTSDGVAVKMVPPAFPAVIDTVSVYITGDGDLETPPPVGFAIRVFGLDANGQPDPNDLLGSATVSASDVLEDRWNSVQVSPSVSVGSRGFAVAWMQLGSGIALGAEQYGPISRRSYEILGGAWAPYRNRETTEFLMRVMASMPVGTHGPQESEDLLEVFPNPTSERVTIRYALENAGEARLALFDLRGNQVWSQTSRPSGRGIGVLELEMGRFPGGMYMLRMVSGGKVKTMKVVATGH
ncbi:MAG: hypothetical protein RLZZ165_500 [Bacteroidota bacterium]